MALEYRREKKHTRVVMTVCPLCGHSFRPRENRSVHLANEHSWRDIPALNGGS